MTIIIWKIWEPARIDELKKEVDSQRITQSKQKKYKAIRTTNKLKIRKQCSSTGKIKGYNKRRYSKETFTELYCTLLYQKYVMICMMVIQERIELNINW